jgi:hypothetical protein
LPYLMLKISLKEKNSGGHSFVFLDKIIDFVGS